MAAAPPASLPCTPPAVVGVMASPALRLQALARRVGAQLPKRGCLSVPRQAALLTRVSPPARNTASHPACMQAARSSTRESSLRPAARHPMQTPCSACLLTGRCTLHAAMQH